MKKVFCWGLVIGLVFLVGCQKKGEESPEMKLAAALAPLPESIQKDLHSFGTSLNKGESLQALASLRAALRHFWEVTPFSLTQVKFVNSDNNSYGIYEPRDNQAFKDGEVIYLYLEPIGFGVEKKPNGKFEFGFQADFSVETEEGKVLGGQKKFATLSFSSWNYNTEIALTFTYTFSGLEKGRYKLATTVRDQVSGEDAVCEKWFEII
ncbi:MAG: hypothetical protein DRI99_02220 [Candidatus Aminicenantes bacterium]|nr:MAG: hypothetical protein DRJ11_11020 [Candidatus Aminicenantes bacterium]RLE05366.1 MAG: hypothetical protein DRI99_02220 [Candidatus Aminicenantes bacterium]